MLTPDRYNFIPPLNRRHLLWVIAWIILIVLIALITSRGTSASPSAFGSSLQSPLATPTPQPLIESFSPVAGLRDVRRHTPLRITFRLDLDHRAIEQGLTIDPPISGTLKWQGRTLIFTPDRGWQPDQMYRITAKYRDQVLPPSWTFITRPLVKLISPSDTSRANWNEPIRILFDEPMDRASVEAAFSINPEARGTFQWLNNTLTFTPQTEWDEGRHYVITLATSLKTAPGEQPLHLPQQLSFTTIDENGEVSFGYGPKIQVIDPAGRRAVQFAAWGTLIRPITVRLYAISLEQFLDRYTSGFRGVGPEEDKAIEVGDLPVLRTWRIPVSPQEFTLPADLAPGLYVLTLEHPAFRRDELMVFYTHNTLVLKQADGHIAAWASQINGGPLDQMRIRVFARDAKLIAEGQTDAQGLFTTYVPIDPQPLIVFGERHGEITASGLSNEWMQGGWNYWWEPRPKGQLSRAYIYTDRPIYRPGQTVYTKVIARYDNDAVYSRIPLEWDVIVRLRDARDNVVATRTLHVNEYGTLDTSFDLAEGGTLGEYHIEVQIKDDVHRQAFKVEEYRKPEFEVMVHADRANVVNGESISLTVQVQTYFGAPLSDATIMFTPYTRNYDWWYGSDWATLEQSRPLGRTDANGQLAEPVTLELNKYRFGNDYYQQHAVPVLMEVTVNDRNGQAVSAQARVVVHDADIDVSGGLDRYMYKPAEPIVITATVHSIGGQPLAEQSVTAQILKWTNNGYSPALTSDPGRTDRRGATRLEMTAPAPGWYRVEISSQDRWGRTVTVIDWLWVYNPAYETPWTYENPNVVQINADKDRYVSGDTAQLLIRSPIAGPALLAVERGRLRRAQVIQLTTPTTVVPLYLQDDDAPNVYVSVNVYQPVQASRDEIYESIPDARLLVASTNLSVSAEQRKLAVAVTPDRSSYAPRETATVTVQVTGMDGKPAQAELSLAVVDEAIYALSEELAQDPFEAFYSERSNAVRTFDALRPVRYIGGGFGGGGGGGDVLSNPRFNFPDTAYWNALVVTDEEGRAVVTTTLPDSLTRWRIVVRAVTADEFPRVGEAVAQITTSQPIVIRPVLPRQFVQGDRVLISAIVHNNTGQDRQATVWADVAASHPGRSAAESKDHEALTLITQTITLSANSSIVVGWPIEVSALGNLTVTMKAKASKAVDAVQVGVPVMPLAVPEVQSIVGDFTSSVEHTIDLPVHTIKEASTLQIDLSPSIAASVLDGLAFLTGYPYGCVEQTMSKALPNAVVGRAFTVLGVDSPQLKADLPRKVNAGLQRLYGFQHNDGGWGWWFDDSTDDYQTAYVLFGLAMTRQAGYEVDQNVIDRGAKYMTERLPGIGDERTKAYALFALAMARHGNLAETQQLVALNLPVITGTQRLDAFSQAGLAIALHELGDEVRAQKMLDRLIGEAVVSDSEAYWDTGAEDGHYHEKTMSSSMRSTALALDAIVRIRPDDPIVTKVVRWLMARRAPTGWGTTQETAYAVVALTDYLRATRELNSGSTYRVLVNDRVVGQGSLSADQIQQTLHIPIADLRDGANRVRIERAGSNGRVYYKITQRALIAGTTDQAAGPIGVTRSYLDPKSNKPITATYPGDVVQVQVKITLPEESWYVALEDPLPGGLEGLNERLNTTSFTAKQGYYEEGEDFFYDDYGYNNKEVRDDRVVFFATHLDKGTHTFTYLARTTQSGTFNALPAQVYLMYTPEQWGRSASKTIEISTP
jgi:uncharacterized protein YfaS (alpha-2-macroglobulin family)